MVVSRLNADDVTVVQHIIVRIDIHTVFSSRDSDWIFQDFMQVYASAYHNISACRRAAQYAAVHAVYLAVRLGEGGVIAAGDKVYFQPSAGQQMLRALVSSLSIVSSSTGCVRR